MRKHRAAVATTGAFVLVLGLATALSISQAIRASQKAQSEAKAKADAQAVLAFFRDKVVAAARPQGQEGGLGHDVTLRAAISAAEPAIAIAFSNQPRAEASVRSAFGASFYYLGDYSNAIKQYERTLYLKKAEFGPTHEKTLTEMFNLAMGYQVA